jgi:type 1 fimbriae regulatory protein FimB
MTRQAVNYLVAVIGKRARLAVRVHPHVLRHSCGYALCVGEQGLRYALNPRLPGPPEHSTYATLYTHGSGEIREVVALGETAPRSRAKQ